MTLRARVDAMKPARPAPTRTAPPRMPEQFWTGGRYRAYIAFGACGFFLMTVALLVLRAVWVLGSHDEAAWNALLADFENPIYLVYHALALLALVWFALRFFRLFPQTQPPSIGPLPRPPDAFFRVALNGGFVLVTVALALVLSGRLP